MAKVTRLSQENSGFDRRRIHLREISDHADAPLETVGEDLRNARQRKGEDLAQVSRALKIRKDHLEALEESNIAALPGRAYAIGFVRSYAQYLGLDANECVERLKTEVAGRIEPEEPTVTITVPRERRLPTGGLIFVLLLVVAAVYGGYYFAVSANRVASPPVTPVPDRLAVQAGLKPPPPAVPGPAPQPAVSQVIPAAEAAPAAQAPAPLAAPATAAPSPAQQAAVVPLPPGQQYGLHNTNSRITLRIHKPVHVAVTGANDFTYLNRILQPGDTYRVPNQVGLRMTTPDAGAVEIILDGSSLGYAGKDGADVVAASLNPQDIVDRQGQSQ
jgi:cytoskeleton protein RodZ